MIAEIVSLSAYESQVSALMDEEERAAMEYFIACGPTDHPLIFRKARWARPGHGRRGGLRVVSKSRKSTLSAADQNVLAKLAAVIKNAIRGRQRL